MFSPDQVSQDTNSLKQVARRSVVEDGLKGVTSKEELAQALKLLNTGSPDLLGNDAKLQDLLEELHEGTATFATTGQEVVLQCSPVRMQIRCKVIELIQTHQSIEEGLNIWRRSPMLPETRKAQSEAWRFALVRFMCQELGMTAAQVTQTLYIDEQTNSETRRRKFRTIYRIKNG